jgi:hypothetical protein
MFGNRASPFVAVLLAALTSGNVFVTGESVGSAACEHATLKYSD